MDKENWMKSVMQGKSKEIAKILFYGFTTQEKISKILYPNRKKRGKGRDREKIIHYVEPIVNKNFQIWKKMGFIEDSIAIPFKDRWDRPQKVHWKIMNLQPIFKYCNEIRNVNFSQEEKDFLEGLLRPIREHIIIENSDEDIINATLKFYTKHFIMNYHLALRDQKDFPEKYKKEKEKAEDLNNPNNPMRKWYLETMKDIYERYNVKKEPKEKMWDVMDVHAYSHENVSNFFIHYYNKLRDNSELVKSVDDKILKSLNIYPTK